MVKLLIHHFTRQYKTQKYISFPRCQISTLRMERIVHIQNKLGKEPRLVCIFIEKTVKVFWPSDWDASRSHLCVVARPAGRRYTTSWRNYMSHLARKVLGSPRRSWRTWLGRRASWLPAATVI